MMNVTAGPADAHNARPALLPAGSGPGIDPTLEN
jgi:hypothetical protein